MTEQRGAAQDLPLRSRNASDAGLGGQEASALPPDPSPDRTWIALSAPPVLLFVVTTALNAWFIFVLGNHDPKFSARSQMELVMTIHGLQALVAWTGNALLANRLRPRLRSCPPWRIAVASVVAVGATIGLMAAGLGSANNATAGVIVVLVMPWGLMLLTFLVAEGVMRTARPLRKE